MTSTTTFESSLLRLEEIVKNLDDPRTDLNTALARYEEGVALLKTCHRVLDNAERKIEMLRTDASIQTVSEEEFRTNVPQH